VPWVFVLNPFSVHRNAEPAYLAPLTKESHCYCAKQIQFPKNQNHYNLLYCKDLSEYSAPRRPKKQTQNKPNFAPPRNTTSDIHHPGLSTVEQSLFTIYTFSSPLVWLSLQSAPNCPQAALMPRPILKRIVVSMPDCSRISAKRSIFSVLLPVNSHPR